MQENGPHQLKKQTNKQTKYKKKKQTPTNKISIVARCLIGQSCGQLIILYIRPAKYPFPLVHASQPHRYDTKLEVFLINCFNLNRFRVPNYNVRKRPVFFLSLINLHPCTPYP